MLVYLVCFVLELASMHWLRFLLVIMVGPAIQSQHRLRILVYSDVVKNIGGRLVDNLRRVRGGNRDEFHSSLEMLSAMLLLLRSLVNVLPFLQDHKGGCESENSWIIADCFLISVINCSKLTCFLATCSIKVSGQQKDRYRLFCLWLWLLRESKFSSFPRRVIGCP